MNGNAAALLSKPAFRKVEWLPRDIAVERRPDGVIVMRSRIPLKDYEPHMPASLAKWAKKRPISSGWRSARARPAMAQDLLWRSQAHCRRADPGAARYEAARQPDCDPVRQLHRACADDYGGDAGAASGGAGVAGLFADEPGSRQAQISFRSRQAGGHHGAGRFDLSESARRARPDRHPGDLCGASARRRRLRLFRRYRSDEGQPRGRRVDRADHAGHRGQAVIHVGLHRHAESRHQHPASARSCNPRAYFTALGPATPPPKMQETSEFAPRRLAP